MAPPKDKNKPSASKDKGKGKEKDLDDTASTLLSQNLALASEFKGLDKNSIAKLLKELSLQEVATGLPTGGKNRKDMASYKFWATQPVARFDEPDNAPVVDGPVQAENPVVPTEGSAMLEGFEWVTLDLNDEAQLKEVYELLTGHYVEDQEAMFRFNYSASFLDWALKSPGWLKQWHVGVRASKSKKLVAFISGIPVQLRVREKVLNVSEINFLCIHKKLREKRLAPVLIKEITRRCNLEGIWNAIYTAGIVLPKPVSTCRYYHRSLNWSKLHKVGFSPLPPNSTPQRQIARYAVPGNTKLKGLREMQEKDIDQVLDLLSRYLERFEMAPVFDRKEIEHWFLSRTPADKQDDRVVWTYVIENDEGKITDMFSFYSLESSVIGNSEFKTVKAAYLFYYASETAFQADKSEEEIKKDLKVRLNELIGDALVLCKQVGFDVLNALTLLDNTLFLEKQKFGAGDGQLHYYLFNWRTAYIRGGVDEKNMIDEKNGSGIGMVML
ncbi:acyl-CoA N-acyltransferase [Pyronema omphalodes]|nr:acyl-CoA N-acyltransferase [Pyronema omphalodes]